VEVKKWKSDSSLLLTGTSVISIRLGIKIQSSILQTDESFLRYFSKFMEPVAGSNPYWKLCYRATSHGWSSSTFHRNCDDKGKTVTIIKKDQYVFGGYTDIPWGMYIYNEASVR